MAEILRILVVDDESLARRGLKLRLADIEGVVVVAEASHGREALQMIVEHQPDLVLLDIQMPGMTGFDVVARLQQDRMPMVIFVTAFDQYAIEAFKVQAIDYLLKPIDQDLLRQAIARAQQRQLDQSEIRDKQSLLILERKTRTSHARINSASPKTFTRAHQSPRPTPPANTQHQHA